MALRVQAYTEPAILRRDARVAVSGGNPMRTLGPAAVALLLVGAAMLAGCSSDRKKVCPRVAVLSEAGSLTRFARWARARHPRHRFPGRDRRSYNLLQYPPAKGNRRVVVEMAPVFVLSRALLTAIVRRRSPISSASCATSRFCNSPMT